MIVEEKRDRKQWPNPTEDSAIAIHSLTALRRIDGSCCREDGRRCLNESRECAVVLAPSHAFAGHNIHQLRWLKGHGSIEGGCGNDRVNHRCRIVDMNEIQPVIRFRRDRYAGSQFGHSTQQTIGPVDSCQSKYGTIHIVCPTEFLQHRFQGCTSDSAFRCRIHWRAFIHIVAVMVSVHSRAGSETDPLQ